MERLLFNPEFLFQHLNKIGVVAPGQVGLGEGDRAKLLLAKVRIVERASKIQIG
jgi:hypothetical protein